MRHSHGSSSSSVLVRRRYGGRIEEVITNLARPISHPWCLYRHDPDAPLDRTERQVAIANDSAPARLTVRIAIPRQELHHFGFNGLCQQRGCPVAQDFRARTPDLAGNPWILQLRSPLVVHAAYSLLAKGG